MIYSQSDLVTMGYDPATAARLASGNYLVLRQKLTERVHPAIRSMHNYYAAIGVLRGRSCVQSVSAYKKVAGLRVLDFGCGDGGISVAFAEAGTEVTALDYNHDRQERLTALANDLGVKFSFVADSEYGASLPAASFDLIVCNDVIEHVDDIGRMAAGHSRLLRPDGLLYLVVPSRYCLRHLWADPHYRLFGVSLMGQRLGAAYVVKVRKAVTNYTVNHLLSWGETVKLYADAGMTLTCASDQELRERMRRRNFATGWKRGLAAVLPESPVVWVHRHFIRPSWVFVGRKV